jgi:hypothetical protein
MQYFRNNRLQFLLSEVLFEPCNILFIIVRKTNLFVLVVVVIVQCYLEL